MAKQARDTLKGIRLDYVGLEATLYAEEFQQLEAQYVNQKYADHQDEVILYSRQSNHRKFIPQFSVVYQTAIWINVFM